MGNVVYHYQQEASSISTLLSVATVLTFLCIGISEIAGKHLNYSKFWNVGSSAKSGQILLSSQIGMLVFYTPAFLAGVSSFLLFPGGGDLRFLMLKSAVTIHFLKRDLEVLFLHKFSGFIVLDTAILVSLSYVTFAAFVVYFQHLTQNFPEPLVDLKYLGLLIFVVGIFGNFYHHYLLSKLRNKRDEGYKIPRGGFFSLVTCPHYLFEILTFVGISFISQTLYSYSFALGSALYLVGRSYTTRKWYISKFDGFPKNVKALIPFVF